MLHRLQWNWIAGLALSLLLGTTARAVTTFSDDFTVFDTSMWTKYGGSNINVDSTSPDMVWAHGARNLSPAARITHAMSTGGEDFVMQFDIRNTNGGNGKFHIGWVDTNQFAYVQNPSNWSQTLESWWDDSYVGFSFGYGGNVSALAYEAGTSAGSGTLGNMGQTWHTLTLTRTGELMTATAVRRSDGTLLGSFDLSLPNPTRSYEYFHLSTTQNICNNWYSDYEIDNVFLQVGSEMEIPEPATLLAGAMGLAGLGRYLRHRSA